ncbi:MAG: tetratricopeptide repeat protein [Candidatus Magnetomorum sp.]|nr:tetratricopeptide repeat protein [Candidatus Magnetomorum sp.]
MKNTIRRILTTVLRCSQMQLLILGVSILCIYGHTMNVPFYMDDYPSIVDNLNIHQLSLKNIWNYSPFRFVTYVSFALNYSFHQKSVFGYHIINILIHFFVGWGIYYLVKVFIGIPKINLNTSNEMRPWLPILSALIFVVHPLNTQAITYIVQRLASLAALFYILSMAFYINARISKASTPKKYILFTCALLFAIMALFTKENTVTLIIIIPCIEIVFFQKMNTSRLCIFGSKLIAIFSFWILHAWIRNINPFSFSHIETFTRLGTDVPRTTYLFTQLKVLWIYIRLFFIPTGLRLDYDIPPATFDWTVFLALICHLLVFWCAFIIRKQKPVVLFSILFYYITHLIESSIIPIKDFCFEHRAYLPNVGLSILCAYFSINIIEKCNKYSLRYALIGVLIVILMVFGILTWERNNLWNNPIAFWRNCSVYSPQKVRVWTELGKNLIVAEKNNEAIEALNNALKYSVNSTGQLKINVQLICNLIVLLHKKGDSEKAIQLANQALQYPINNLYRFYILNNLGNIYIENKFFALAENYYRKAIGSYSNNEMAFRGLYYSLILQDKSVEAGQILSNHPDLLKKLRKK